MRRRHLLSCFALGASSSVLAGCGLFDRGTISISIMNRSDRAHQLELTLAQDGEESYSNDYELSPEATVYEEDVLTGGQYAVRAVVDQETTARYRLQMNDCDEQELTVTLSGSGDVSFDSAIC